MHAHLRSSSFTSSLTIIVVIAVITTITDIIVDLSIVGLETASKHDQTGLFSLIALFLIDYFSFDDGCVDGDVDDFIGWCC